MPDNSKSLVYPQQISDDSNKEFNIISYMQFTIYERSSTVNQSVRRVILLYMPEQFSTPTSVSWETDEFGSIVGSFSENGMSADQLTGGLGFVSSNAMDILKGIGAA